MKNKRIMKAILAVGMSICLVIPTGITAGEFFVEDTEIDFIDMEDVQDEVPDLAIDFDDAEAVTAAFEDAGNDVDFSDELVDFVDLSDEIDDAVEAEGDLDILDTLFENGYVEVRKDAVAYKNIEKAEAAGSFINPAIVYAELFLKAEEAEDDWLKITFDTVEAKEAGEELQTAFVQFKDVTILTEEAVWQLKLDLQEDETVRIYQDNLLPCVELVSDFSGEIELTFEDAEEEDVVAASIASDVEVEGEEAEDMLGTSEFEDEVFAAGAMSIVSQPVDCSVAVGEQATFTVEATNVASYQWQYKSTKAWYNTSSTGAKTKSITVDCTEARYNYTYRCILTDSNGNTMITNVVKMIAPVFEIVKQPVDCSVEVGETATFTVNATAVVSYQWQFKNGSKWANTSSTGAKTNTITVECTEARYNYLYRCILTDSEGNTLTTNSVKMVQPTFEIVEQPVDCVVAVGETASFSVYALGAVSYQWQFKNGSKWANTSSTGAKTDTITVSCTEARYSYLYRCIITDKNGNTLTTDSVKMISPVIFEIVNQPVDVEVAVGDTATFTVTATGAESYQWQFKSSNTWKNTSSEGATTDTITVVCNETRYKYEYRCILTAANGDTLITDSVKMIKPEVFEIVKQPEDCEVSVGETAIFTVEATGVTSYQWQFKNGSKWANTSSTGAKTDTISVVCTEARYNYLYRCILTDSEGNTLITNEVRMLPDVFEIVKQPEDCIVAVGEQAIFTVQASGVESYQWQFKSRTTWSNTSSAGATTDTITVDCNEKRYAYEYRCILTGKDGSTLTTNVVRMIAPAFEIVKQPEDFEVEIGGTATFSVEATGAVSYQWQFKSSKTWSNTSSTGATTDTISVVCTEARYNYQYRCILTDKDGNTLTTNAVKMVNPNIVLNEVTYTILEGQDVQIFSYTGSASDLIIPETVEKNGVVYTVKKVGDSAFEGNTTLISIDLPDTITVIGKRAFAGCTSLSTMN